MARKKQPPARSMPVAEAPTLACARFLARLETTPWLEPDATLERGGDEALRWIEECVDQYASVLNTVARAPERASISLGVWVTRSAWEAYERWEPLAKTQRDAQDPSDRAWHWALLDATLLLHRPRENEGTVLPRGPDVSGALAYAGSNSARWKRATKQHPKWTPPERAAGYHAWWLQRFGDTPERPSPWAFPMELWFAGAWPFPLGGGTLGVYLPQRGPDDLLVTEPRSDEPRGWPLRTQALLPGLDHAFGFGPPAPPPKER